MRSAGLCVPDWQQYCCEREVLVLRAPHCSAVASRHRRVRSFPERTTPDQWQHSRDRAEADTNPDVRAEVQRAGYCLFAISASFDELDRDLRSVNRG